MVSISKSVKQTDQEPSVHIIYNERLAITFLFSWCHKNISIQYMYKYRWCLLFNVVVSSRLQGTITQQWGLTSITVHKQQMIKHSRHTIVFHEINKNYRTSLSFRYEECMLYCFWITNCMLFKASLRNIGQHDT